MLNNSKNNTSQTWSVVNEILGSKSGSEKPINKLIRQANGVDEEITSIPQIVNEFNSFFVNIGPRLSNALPKTDNNFVKYLGTPVEKSFFWKPVTQSEVLNTK